MVNFIYDRAKRVKGSGFIGIIHLNVFNVVSSRMCVYLLNDYFWGIFSPHSFYMFTLVQILIESLR